MPIGRRGKTALLIASGVAFAGYIFFWALVMVFSGPPLAFKLGPFRIPIVYLYLIFASTFLGITAVSISLKAVNVRWKSFVWYLVVTAIPLLLAFV